MQTSHNTLKNIIFTGLFAAIIFIGISLLRIPIPAMVGRPFIHFGNPLMVLAPTAARPAAARKLRRVIRLVPIMIDISSFLCLIDCVQNRF